MGDSVPIVRATNIEKTYRLGLVRVAALQDVSLPVRAGELVALAGPSGSGKSTLLNLIGCLDRPDAGDIHLGEQRVSHLPAPRLTELRRERLGFIFQSFNLVPVLTARENVEYPLLLPGVGGAERRRARRRAARPRRARRKASPPAARAVGRRAPARRHRARAGQPAGAGPRGRADGEPGLRDRRRGPGPDGRPPRSAGRRVPVRVARSPAARADGSRHPLSDGLLD